MSVTEKELKIIKSHLASGKMTFAVKDAITNCLSENRELKEENERLLKERKQLFNRCKVMTRGTICEFCGFKGECCENDGE